ncbi:MAG: hypothetical protein U9N34_05550, partial [Candidatus Cloacimonadota bacterium]|nr:hypothetical protein [Candidatus Cloacimonadota bacterium]
MKLSLDTKERKFLNKSALRRFKKAGNIPAIVYSEGKEGYKISVNQREFQLLIRDSVGGIAIISMKLDGREIQTIIKDK